LQEVADGGNTPGDGAFAEVAEAEDELRRAGRAAGAVLAHAVQADGAGPGRGDDLWFVCATITALGRASQHEAGVISGIVQTFNQVGAAICVALASTVAAAGLTRTPSTEGFTDAFTVFTVAAAVAAVLSLRLVPSGTPQMTGVPHAH